MPDITFRKDTTLETPSIATQEGLDFHPHSQRMVRTRQDASNEEATPLDVAIQTFILTSTGLSTRKQLEHSRPHGPGIAKEPIQSATPPWRSSHTSAWPQQRHHHSVVDMRPSKSRCRPRHHAAAEAPLQKTLPATRMSHPVSERSRMHLYMYVRIKFHTYSE